MLKIERDKVYLTRDGEKVRVVCVDAALDEPVIAIHDDGIYTHAADGSFHGDAGPMSAFDLVSEYVEPPKPREVWVREFGNGELGLIILSSKEDAPVSAGRVVKFREVIADE